MAKNIKKMNYDFVAVLKEKYEREQALNQELRIHLVDHLVLKAFRQHLQNENRESPFISHLFEYDDDKHLASSYCMPNIETLCLHGTGKFIVVNLDIEIETTGEFHGSKRKIVVFFPIELFNDFSEKAFEAFVEQKRKEIFKSNLEEEINRIVFLFNEKEIDVLIGEIQKKIKDKKKEANEKEKTAK